MWPPHIQSGGLKHSRNECNIMWSSRTSAAHYSTSELFLTDFNRWYDGFLSVHAKMMSWLGRCSILNSHKYNVRKLTQSVALWCFVAYLDCMVVIQPLSPIPIDSLFVWTNSNKSTVWYTARHVRQKETGGDQTEPKGGWKLDLCLSGDQKHALKFMQILLLMGVYVWICLESDVGALMFFCPLVPKNQLIQLWFLVMWYTSSS